MVFRVSYALTALLLCIMTAAFTLVSGGLLTDGVLYTLILLVFERLAGRTAYGCRADSRLWFTGIFLALSPALIASKQASVEYWSALFFAVCAQYAAIELLEDGERKWMFVLLLAGPAAVIYDIRLAALLMPVAIQPVLNMHGRRSIRSVFAASLPMLSLLIAVALPLHRLQEVITSWEFSNLVNLVRDAGSTGEIPGLLYMFYPLAHPWFNVLLPGLFLFFRKTDLVNPARRMLLDGAFCYLLLVGGLPGRDILTLTPAYMVLLTVVFPSWDRMYCYGLYFFRKAVWLTIGTLLLTQMMLAGYKIIMQG